MFNGFSAHTIDFLWGIRFNNNREWFLAHKSDYQTTLYEPMRALAAEVEQRFQLPGTIYKVSRIYRDVRYSNGIPYKEHLWFCIREDNVFWSEHPSLYFQIEPEGGSYGFIYYAPKAANMALFRKELLAHPRQFAQVMGPIEADARFQDGSTRYKRPKPGGTPETEPYYQLKNFYYFESIPAGDALFSKDLPVRLADGFAALTPLYHYFRTLETR